MTHNTPVIDEIDTMNKAEANFTNAMIQFYNSCHLSKSQIQLIIQAERHSTREYLAATPELIARKFYQEVIGKELC